MQIIVDRIEGQLAICESEAGKMTSISLSEFLEIPQDGDIFILEQGIWKKNDNETKLRKKEMQNRFNRLKKQ